MTSRAIFLIGLSGSGKSTAGRILAERLGWAFADTDAMIEAAAGRSIPEIFRDEGEARFREREVAALREVRGRDGIVVATGGGAPTTAAGRAAIASGLVVWLDVTPEEAVRRLQSDPGTEARPLLEGDALARLRALDEARRPIYERADAHVDVDSRPPEEVAETLRRLWEAEAGVAPGPPDRLESPFQVAATVSTRATSATYPVVVEDGALGRLGAVCRAVGLGGRAFLVTDAVVAPLFGSAAMQSLESAGYRAESFALPAGEEHKTLGTLAVLYDWLLQHRVERTDFVVALGGGVVTDVGGFAAATILRGIDFVHVPTTLLGMVDAAIGGKTGIDHARGKNMIGAFAQPRAVVIDPLVLRTLPRRQLINGWAELVKHGLILDAGLFGELEAAAGDPEATMRSPALIARSTAIKAAVVSDDEREAGRRTLLNYGHTLGHAIEAVSGYTTYLHGEAVAVGMRAAGLISIEMGLLAPADFERQQAVIRAYGLPESAPGLDVDAVIDATRGDKKARAGKVQWVLLDAIGHAVTRGDVPPEVVRRAAETVLR
ncbi:MAG: 3-dehydroquinate synthase [Chloroflexi bacterium]|nr:3-dehydroquinate synthase [Chloroflexota bacterium]